MLWKCCTQYANQFGKLSQWPQDWKRSVFILIPKKGNAKECSNFYTMVLISHASKVIVKILQARLQQYDGRKHFWIRNLIKDWNQNIKRTFSKFNNKNKSRASLMIYWLRICLPMQETQVWFLVQKDPTCHGVTVCSMYRPCVPQV